MYCSSKKLIEIKTSEGLEINNNKLNFKFVFVFVIKSNLFRFVFVTFQSFQIVCFYSPFESEERINLIGKTSEQFLTKSYFDIQKKFMKHLLIESQTDNIKRMTTFYHMHYSYSNDHIEQMMTITGFCYKVILIKFTL